MSKKQYPAAIDILADAITAKRAELAELEEAFRAVGGEWEEDGEAEAEPPRQITGPKAKGRDRAVTIDSVVVTLTERQAEAMQKLIAAREADVVVGIDDLAGIFGGIKQNWYANVAAINKALEPAGHIVANVRGLGYRLEQVT